MRRSASALPHLLLSASLIYLAGCQAAGLRFLNLIGLEKEPLSVALVVERPEALAQALDPFASYKPLQTALSNSLGRPVAIDVCFPFQVQSGLATGWYDMAVVTPTQYARLCGPDSPQVLAMALDEQGRAARCGLLVVPADSPIAGPTELRGKVVAFGPVNDARTHWGGLRLLSEAGLKKTDLALELLPVPGSLKHLPDSRAVAQTVINGSSAAGLVDEAAWESFPQHDEREDQPARDKLRILAGTQPLPNRLVLGSARLSQETAARVRECLVNLATRQPEALKPLKLSGYQQPDDELLSACRALGGATTTESPTDTNQFETAGD